MKGLIFYDAHVNDLYEQHYYCNICGRQITGSKAWVYREGGITLLFCGDTADCRDEFLELNKLQDVDEYDEEE